MTQQLSKWPLLAVVLLTLTWVSGTIAFAQATNTGTIVGVVRTKAAQSSRTRRITLTDTSTNA